MKLSRDDFRRLKSYSKEEMEKWLQMYYNTTYNGLRKAFNNEYMNELDSSVQNFITAIAYTLHFSEEVHLQADELASFMNDLFVTVDLFRKGEYNPEDYKEQLRGDGIEIAEYDYDRLYREKDAPYKEKYDKLVEFLNKTTSKAKVVDEIKSLLEVREDDRERKTSERDITIDSERH